MKNDTFKKAFNKELRENDFKNQVIESTSEVNKSFLRFENRISDKLRIYLSLRFNLYYLNFTFNSLTMSKSATSEKISFISILRTIAYLKNNVMSDFLKRYKFEIDAEENVIKIFSKANFEKKSRRSAAPYEIEVRLESAFRSKYTFTLVDILAQYDSETGSFNERYFNSVNSIVDVFSQLIEEELNNFQEYQFEVAERRRKAN